MKRNLFLRLMCVLLALFLCVGVLVSCGGGDDTPDKDNNDNNDKDNNGGSDIQLKDKNLVVSISKAQDPQGTFPAANIYTMGPDGNTTDEVQKMVLARNKQVAKDLGLTVEFQTTELTYDLVLEDVTKLVQGSAADAPDVYNNDIYGLTRAMMNNLLWNVSDPGEDGNGDPVTSYFDFEKEGWFYEYMQGSSFSKDKLYLLAGDYNIDLIRFAWVLFINIDKWDEAYASSEFGTYEYWCDYVYDTHEWYYDNLVDLGVLGHNDDGGDVLGDTDRNDDVIALRLNNVCDRIFIWGSGVSIFDWNGDKAGTGEVGVGTPKIVTDTTDLSKLGQKYTELFNAIGVFYYNDVLSSTTDFMNGKIIMAQSKLGEMESDQMRKTPFGRGILPFPKYLKSVNLHTVVHDQAEVTAILNTTSRFETASAYMQKINEASVSVMAQYYEKSLKFKYNDSEGVRNMIDLVHDTIDSPFESLIGAYLCAEDGGSQVYSIFQNDATGNKTQFSSTYDSRVGGLQTTLDGLLDKFSKLD